MNQESVDPSSVDPPSIDLQAMSARISAIAESDGRRPALVGADGRLTWADLARQLADDCAGAETDRPRLRQVTGSVTDIVGLLTDAVAGASTLVVDAASTDWERRRAADLFHPTEPGSLGLCTSGTSGLPTVVTADWASVLTNAAAFGHAAGIAEQDVVWCSTPVHHRFALAAGTLGSLLQGATVLLRPGLVGPGGFGRQLLAAQVSVILSVPFLYRRFVADVVADPALRDRWSLRRCISAGEALRPELAEQWRSATGLPLISHYGTTEDGQISVGDGTPGEGEGRPVPGVEVRTDPRRVLEVRTGTGRWRPTGDSGWIDDAGNVHVTGRVTDRINVGGKKVDPTEVEQAVRLLPAVGDCIVAGVPGDDGDTVVAWLSARADLPTDAELRAHLRTLLSPHKIPRRFLRLDELPRTQTGKPRRGVLVATFLAS